MNSLARALDAEFKRVALEEGKSMNDLIDEVSKVVGKTPRTLYNYRSGKWPVPADVIPILCQRFNSNTLLDVLKDAAISPDSADVLENDVPLDVWGQTRQILNDVILQCDLVQQALDPGREFTKAGLTELAEVTDRIIRAVRRQCSTVEAEYERRRGAA